MATPQTRVTFGLSVTLLERIDKRIGHGNNRNAWLRDACELKLALEERTGKWTAEAVVEVLEQEERQA